MVTRAGRDVTYEVNHAIVLHKCVARFVSDSWWFLFIILGIRHLYLSNLTTVLLWGPFSGAPGG